MIVRTPAIVLNQFRYSDSSFIAHVLTERYGHLALLVRGNKSRKSRSKQVYFQPLYLLELELDYKENRDLQHVRELRPIELFHNISTDIRKQTVSIFIAEVLQRSVKPEQVDEVLFQYVFHSIILFEQLGKGSSIFHHYFLTQLMKYLGFAPGNSRTEENPLLHTESGLFVGYNELNPSCLNDEESYLISMFLKMGPDELPLFNLSKEKKKLCLESILLYYSKHIPDFDRLKSYNILRDVFA